MAYRPSACLRPGLMMRAGPRRDALCPLPGRASGILGWLTAPDVDGQQGAVDGRRAGLLVRNEADNAAHSNAGPVLQLKIRLLEVSPMVWRRLLAPAGTSWREEAAPSRSPWAGRAFICPGSASARCAAARSSWRPSRLQRRWRASDPASKAGSSTSTTSMSPGGTKSASGNLSRSEREGFLPVPFSRRAANDRLRRNDHPALMHQ